MAEPIVFVLVYYSRHTANSPSTSVIAVLLPAVGIEPTSRYQRTFLRRKPYTTRLPKYLSNSRRGTKEPSYDGSLIPLGYRSTYRIR